MNEETQADIIREMRDLGALDAQCNDMIPRSLQALGLRTYAGRLEAARKRETAGSAAAMRAALEEQLRYRDTHVRTRDEEAMRQHIEAALAKPARNCDRFRTADEVSAYWGANVHAVPLHGDAYGMHIDGETYPTFLDWLFATAEGGEK